jgi:hypothetical protein
VRYGRLATFSSLLDLGLVLDLHLDLPSLMKRRVETQASGRCVSKATHGAGRSGRLRATASRGGAAASYMATCPRGLPGPGGTTPGALPRTGDAGACCLDSSDPGVEDVATRPPHD